MKYELTEAEEAYITGYVDSKPIGRKPTEAAIGFIIKNKAFGKTNAELDAIIENAVKLKDGEILGEGDLFKRWCIDNGRDEPPEHLVPFMNRDPYAAAQFVKASIPTQPAVWRNWCTYRSGKGRRNV